MGEHFRKIGDDINRLPEGLQRVPSPWKSWIPHPLKATDPLDGSQGLSILPWPIGVYLVGITLTLFISFPTGFEGCSMVPTIYPLETLHNALSLRQVSEFLTKVCQRHTDAHAQASAGMGSTVCIASSTSIPVICRT
jgi:hypothetical protein